MLRFPLSILLTLTTLAVWCASCLAGGLPAQPQSATFTGHEARLTVSQKLVPTKTDEGYRLVIHLPAKTVRASLTLAVNGKPVDTFTWVDASSPKVDPPPALISAAEKDEGRKRLLADIESLIQKGAALEAAQKSLELRLLHWESVAVANAPREDAPAAKSPTPGNEAKVDELLEARVPAIVAALRTGQAAIDENARLLAIAQKALQTHDAARTGETVLVPAKSPEAVQLHYSYTLPANARLHYHLDAHPGQNALDVTSLAELRQTTGIDWKGVDVSIALSERRRKLTPSSPHPWIIDYAEKKAPHPIQARARVAEQQSLSAAPPPADVTPSYDADNERRPEAVQGETYRLWKLGKRDIASDLPLSVQLAQATHPATFAYTLRPRQQRQAYLRANVTFKQPEELPPGRADCFVDGDFVGTQTLGLSGTEATIFLGTDPMVLATVHDMDSKRGEQGLISKSQTKNWHWKIVVENKRTRKVDVRVEEAAPVVRDSSIQLRSVATPTPVEVVPQEASADPALRYLVWEKQVDAQGTFAIEWRVAVEAAADKTLAPGR
jgi:uncharacterized protein (TIGR02231 family)